jgi:hypothetical protein
MPENDHRKHEVRVRLTAQEHQQVRRAAAARSLPTALWLRQLALAAAVRTGSETSKLTIIPPSTKEHHVASNRSDDQLKQELLERARSGAPRPRLDADDPGERELAEALLRFTTEPSDQDASRN